MASMKSSLFLMLPGMYVANVSIPVQQIAEGVQMPVISIGVGGNEISKASVIASTWLKLGGRGIDTALLYGDQTEVADVLAKSGLKREDVFITSKILGCSNAAANVEKDLKQLATSYIDLMLIHFPRGGDCAAAWATLEDYHAQGKLKAIGVSHYTRSDIESLMKTAKVTPAINQIELNVLEHDDDQIAASKEHGITLEAYAPVGRGGEAGNIPGNKIIQSIGAAHNVNTYQVALKWILQHGHTLTFQSSSEAHQASDADVFSFTLSDSEMRTLDNLQRDPAILV
jgi:diketogulonate reductase-like aldo/keto reductase